MAEKLIQQMKQQQRLTPQQLMLQRLLHLPVQELEQKISEEVERNPLLEMELPTTESLPEAADGYEPAEADDDYVAALPRDPNARREERQYQSELSFADRLMEQFDLKPLGEADREIGHMLIGNIDDSGYLTRDLGIVANDIALYRGYDVSPADVERVLLIVQSLDPAGIAARSLQECLSLQLHRIENPSDAQRLAAEVVDQRFDDFSQRRYEAIMDKMRIGRDELAAAAAVILRLDPKPGACEADEQQGVSIVPDCVVSAYDDNVSFFINDKSLPKLSLNSEYMTMLKSLEQKPSPGRDEKETMRFIGSNADAAEAFMEAVNMRHQTLAKVMKELTKVQHKYFLTGDIKDLAPYSQKRLAQAVGLDESTISRMVNSKYIQTPFGSLPMKALFSTAVTGEDGEEVSAAAVKQLLAEAVAAEDKRQPLSDQKLSDYLAQKGYATARRTVAKYRERLGIPEAKLRKLLTVLALLLALAGMMPLQAQTPETKAPADSAKSGPEHPVGEVPATMWYGTSFSDLRVRMKEMPLDSLPDEINLKLLRSNEQFVFPIKNVRTSPYGWRWERAHRGVDIALRTGDPIHCAFDGMVRIAKVMGGYGNLVVVRHYNGLETVYGHMSKINVHPRQIVKAGDVLGLGGSTGHSTGPHLHFEVRFMYETFDPEWLLDFKTYTLRTKRLHLDKSYFGVKKPRGVKGEELAYKADKSYIKEVDRKAPREMYYVVKSGEVLSDIAHRYSTTVEKILSLNEGLSKKPKPGTRIRVR